MSHLKSFELQPEDGIIHQNHSDTCFAILVKIVDVSNNTIYILY